jgi:heat shock protein HslJ
LDLVWRTLDLPALSVSPLLGSAKSVAAEITTHANKRLRENFGICGFGRDCRMKASSAGIGGQGGCVKPSPFIALAALALLAIANASPLLAATVMPGTVHTSQNALDWAGVYRGVIPCADCQGIETVVVLKPNGVYTTLTKYLGKSDEIFSKDGHFTWNANGNTITLAGVQYLVGENHLTRLAQDGSRITGALADDYVLTKVPEDAVTERYWKLVELNGKPLPKLDREPWFILKEADGRMNGFGSCNSFTGSYKLDPAASRVSFSQIATTQKMCISGMEVEDAFHEVLKMVDNYSLAGDRLTLNRARMAPLARFEAVYLR